MVLYFWSLSLYHDCGKIIAFPNLLYDRYNIDYLTGIVGCTCKTSSQFFSDLPDVYRDALPAELLSQIEVEVTPFNITTLIPVPNRGFLNVKNVSTYQLMSDMYGNNTAFIKEWHFSCRYETTQRSSYLWPCEPFTSAKMLSAEFHQTFSTLRALKVPYSLSSTELGDLFSITAGVFAFFVSIIIG